LRGADLVDRHTERSAVCASVSPSAIACTMAL
jgi:hypothetical protein